MDLSVYLGDITSRWVPRGGAIGDRVAMGVLKRTYDMFFGGGGVQYEASCAACQALMSLIVLSATRNVIL